MKMLPTYYIVYEPCYAYVLCIDEAFVWLVFFQQPDDLLGAADFQNTGAKTYLLQKYNENRTRLVELFTGSLSIYPNTWTKPKKGEAGEIPSL